MARQYRHPDKKGSSTRLAVKLAHTKSFDGYASGFAAYEVWIRDLLDDTRFDKLDQKPRFAGQRNDSHEMVNLNVRILSTVFSLYSRCRRSLHPTEI